MTLINDFLSLIYPRSCEACGLSLYRHEQFICNSCVLNLPKSNYHLNGDSELSMVFGGRVPLVNACSYYTYEKKGRVQRMLHAIKYHGQKELAEHLGGLYAADLRDTVSAREVDLLIPIPLHRNKLKSRGYNQSEWFARGLSKGLEKPLDCVHLQRNVETATQTKKKKYQRWENVEGIFTLKNREELGGRHVMLVDDVITTGATIEAAWLALKEVTGIKVSVASIAFAAKGF